MPEGPACAVDNAILSALPPDERARLAPLLEVVDVAANQPVSRRGEPMAHVYFPAGALFSVLSASADGRMVEVGALGREGFVGLPVVLGDDAPAFGTIGQVPGRALRMTADHLRLELARGGPLRRGLLRAAQAQAVQGAQTAACNWRCAIDQRTARWLLHCADWTGRESFPLAQEFLGYMLGVRSPSVSTAAAILRRAGFVAQRGGVVSIVDREGLQGATCGCYALIRDEHRRLVSAA
jgi:CRP-like cAMP-binding protein